MMSSALKIIMKKNNYVQVLSLIQVNESYVSGTEPEKFRG